MVEDHSAVWPAVVIHKTQVREESYSNRLKAPLVTHSETIAIDLVKAERVRVMLSVFSIFLIVYLYVYMFMLYMYLLSLEVS